MSINLLLGAVQEGLVYALVALGLFVSYRVLNIADMTTDGTFVLGMGVSAVFTMNGHPVLGIAIALFAGALAGLITALLQTLLSIPSILAGIITMVGLYSINLMVMGGSSSLMFLNNTTIFSKAIQYLGKQWGVILPLIAFVLLAGLILIMFFKTRIGLSVRATGDNPKMVQASSINPVVTVTVGLCISNALVACGGALLAQMYTLSDINLGTGIVVVGLASLVFGRIIFRKPSIVSGVLAAIVGSVLYRIVLTIALRTSGRPELLKLVSAVLITVVLGYPKVALLVREQSKRRRESKNYASPK